ncbi:MAG TPA: hypothetical protein VF175_00460 [Lacipirellula sp.]
MSEFFSNFDALWTLAALVPLAIAAAAWSLQLACGFCSEDPPEFWHAVTTVVIIAIANVILRFILYSNDAAHGIAAEYFAPILASSAVTTVSLPTGPFTALTITVVQMVLCAMMYYGLLWLQAIVTSSVMML